MFSKIGEEIAIVEYYVMLVSNVVWTLKKKKGIYQ